MSEENNTTIEPGDDAWSSAMHVFQTWHRQTVDRFVSESKAEQVSRAKELLTEDNIMEVLAQGCDHLLDQVNEQVDDWLHESVDGCGEVIYTHQAKVMLLVSGNEDAYVEEIGEAAPSIHAQSYMALRADIREAME